MNPRRRAIADWFLEVSALLVVFPAVDLFLKEGRFAAIVVLPVAFALLLLWLGLYLVGRS